MNADFFDELNYIKQLPGDFPYEMVEKVGEGGMGEVYKAVEKNSRRIVAIKFIAARDRQQTMQKRFLREAQLSAQLNHPNIIKVHNIGLIKNHLYIAMEYIHGKTLDSCLQEFSQQQKLVILEKIARALHYAHGKGIVHRDIKPANIIITEENEPIVMDFGLAKSIAINDRSVTKTGEVIGTPRYMPLEQMQGRYHQIDGLVDVYALGVILYEMISGVHMIPGESSIEILYNLQAENIAPLPPDVAKDLQSIWLKATAPHSQRYKSAQIFADDIRKFLLEEKVSARWFGSYHRFKKILQWASVVLVILVAVAVYRNFFRNANFKIHITPLMQADILINQKLYAAALDHLHRIEQNDENIQLKIYQKLIITHVNLKQYQQAQDIFKKHLQKQPLDTPTALALMEMYHAQRNLAEISKIQVDTKNPELLAKQHYYQGTVLYEKKQYVQALSCFEKARKAYHDSKYKLFIARCHYQIVRLFSSNSKSPKNKKDSLPHRQTIENAIAVLQNTVKMHPENIRILGYLGECYFIYHRSTHLNSAEKSRYLSLAMECFKTCIDHENNSHYYVLLGRAYFHQKKYINAYKALLKSIEVGGANLTTANLLLRVLLQIPSLNENSMFLLKDLSNKAIRVTPPNLFQQHFVEIQETYESDYNKQLIAKKNRGEIQGLLSKIKELESIGHQNLQDFQRKVYNDAVRGLISLRYHPQLEQQIRKLAIEFPKNKQSQIINIWSNIAREKTRESMHALYHQMALFYLQNDEKTIQQIDRELLKEIVHDHKQNIYTRYLAAKTLLNLLEFSELEILSDEFTTHNRDLIGSMIAVVVLREANIRKETSIFSHIKNVDSQVKGYAFLCAIIGRSSFIYLTNGRDNMPRDTWRLQTEQQLQTLHYLMNKNNIRIQLNAAASAYALDKDASALQILKKNMDSSATGNWRFRAHAHYYFWSAPHMLEEADKFLEEYKAGLRDPDENIQAITLFFLHYFINTNISDFTEDLERLSQKPSNIGLRAIFGYCNKSQSYERIKEKFINNPEQLPFVQVYTYMLANFLRIFTLNGKIQNIEQFRKTTQEFPDILQNSHLILRQWACWFFSSLNYYRLDIVAKQSPLLQNSVLVSMRQPHIKSSFIGLFLKQTTTREKLQFIEKNLQSDNPLLQKNAMAAKVLLSQKRHRLYKESLRSENKNIQYGAAIGFYSILRFNLDQPQLLLQANIHKNMDNHYEDYIKVLRRHSQQRQFLRWLTYAIELAKDWDTQQEMLAEQMAKFYYERAVIFGTQSKVDLAITDLQQAIKLRPEYSRYKVELAELYCFQQKYDKVQAILPGLKNPGTPALLNRQTALYDKIGLYKNAHEICKYMLINGRRDFHALLLAKNTLYRANHDKQLTAEQITTHKNLARKYLLYAVRDNLRRHFDPKKPRNFWITHKHINSYFPILRDLAKDPQIQEQIRLIEEHVGDK